MHVTLPADLSRQVEQELVSGGLDALRRIGQAVDQAGLYERVLIPDEK